MSISNPIGHFSIKFFFSNFNNYVSSIYILFRRERNRMSENLMIQVNLQSMFLKLALLNNPKMSLICELFLETPKLKQYWVLCF